jgi:two-component system response regulator AlgR
MRVLIVDDEPLARLRLRTLLDGISEPTTTIVGEAGDADAALLALNQAPADLVLLDIAMPGRDGLRLAQALKALPSPPVVVFVTAHAQHALAAFEVEAADYLTKPVRRERLQAALERVAARLLAMPTPAAGVPGAAEPVLVVSDRGRVLRLPVREVLYLKAEQKYVTLRTAQHTHVLDDALADLELRLGPGFLRVHRNALVAVQAIRALEFRVGTDDGEAAGDSEGWAVRVAPLDEWLAVSRRQLAAVRAVLSKGA